MTALFLRCARLRLFRSRAAEWNELFRCRRDVSQSDEGLWAMGDSLRKEVIWARAFAQLSAYVTVSTLSAFTKLHPRFLPTDISDNAAMGADERQFLADAARRYHQSGAYAHLQGTWPQTPAYALNDSPAGLAAWIFEKFLEWSDCKGDLYSVFSVDELLTNITIYSMTETISSSFACIRRKEPRLTCSRMNSVFRAHSGVHRGMFESGRDVFK